MIEDKEDFFEQSPDDAPPKPEKTPREPRIYDDDPRYYDREESRWEHLKPSPYRKGPAIMISIAVVIVMCILIGFYIFLFTPQVTEAEQYGYVENVQREGTLFETYEGVILPYRSIKDTTRSYKGDFVFSAKNDSIAGKLRRQQRQGRPVRVGYEIYRVKLPWRGNSKTIVTSVDTIVNPAKLIPMDRRPERP